MAKIASAKSLQIDKLHTPQEPIRKFENMKKELAITEAKNEEITNRNIVVFTGQSGIKVEKCLEKVKQSLPGFNVEILRIEKAMIETYKETHPDKKAFSERRIIVEILSLPPFAQRALWDKSFESIQKQLNNQDPKKLYFLSFHACFYHQKNREFLSPISLEKLVEIRKRVKMVIVLVDDCYDVYRRLLATGEMFFQDVISPNVTPEEAMVKSIFNLLTVLSWREIEIAFSRKISEIMGPPIPPMFVVAVKHPISLAQRLVSQSLEESRIFYVAHPITSIRKRTHARTAKFPENLNSFVENLYNMHENDILFLPDTVDELRIVKENEYYLPELSSGWSLPFDEDSWLFNPLPNEVKGYNPLNPKDFKIPEDKKEAVSYMVALLARKIDEQITSRDYALVEQSKDGIIIFQPYWEGDISGGALKEANYNSLLRDEIQNDRKTIIVEMHENLGKYRITELFTELVTVALEDVDDNIRKKLRTLEESLKKDMDVVRQFYEGNYPLPEIISKAEQQLPDIYNFNQNFIRIQDPSLHGATMLEADERLKAGWAALYERVIELDPFKAECINQADEYCIAPSHDFDKRVQEFMAAIHLKQEKTKTGD